MSTYTTMERLKPDFGIGRTLGYELLNRGAIRARKLGRKTLIEVGSVEEFLAKQPAYQGGE